MRQTQLFTKTRKEAPSDELARNAQLLIRGGYVHKEMAGVYAYLPLGLRVIEKIKQIVREEMDSVGGQELLMTTLQNKQLWEQTNRWDDSVVDVWFKSELHAGGEVGFGWSHEEPIANMLRNYVSSYKHLPFTVYQFQTKLRNELRAKSGLLRGREFLMKDAYTFCATEEQHNEIYDAIKTAYDRIFDRVGLGADTYVTLAAGGAFTEFSHEFQTICTAGEDECYIAKDKKIAVNEEVYDPTKLAELGVSEDEMVKTTMAEVGNIFNFGRQKASDIGLTFKDDHESDVAVWMGSYGIGISRLMGVITEKYSDRKGIVWPDAVAPFTIHLIGLNLDDAEVSDWANGLYSTLTAAGIEALFDDRVSARAGEKFTDSDLIGIPYRVVASRKTKESGQLEIVTRASGDTRLLSIEEVLRDFASENTK